MLLAKPDRFSGLSRSVTAGCPAARALRVVISATIPYVAMPRLALRIICVRSFYRFRLALPWELSCYLQDRFGGKDVRACSAPLPSDDALEIHKEEISLRNG